MLVIYINMCTHTHTQTGERFKERLMSHLDIFAHRTHKSV